MPDTTFRPTLGGGGRQKKSSEPLPAQRGAETRWGSSVQGEDTQDRVKWSQRSSLGDLKTRGGSSLFSLEAGGNQSLKRGSWVKNGDFKAIEHLPEWLEGGACLPSREEDGGLRALLQDLWGNGKGCTLAEHGNVLQAPHLLAPLLRWVRLALFHRGRC